MRLRVRRRTLREQRAELAYNEGMAQQIGIDGALLDAQAKTRGENILKLYPEVSGVQVSGVQFFGFHDLVQRWNGDAAETQVNS
jgi:hypothetical protein